MGVFDGSGRILKTFMQGGTLDMWNKNSGTTLMEAIETALRCDGKYVSKHTNHVGNLMLEYSMFHHGDKLKVFIIEEKNIGICVNTVYPVDTEHLTRDGIDFMLHDINAHCETGAVIYDEELHILSYGVMYNLNEDAPEGICVDFVLFEASEATDTVLDYLDKVREEYNLYIG